MRMQNTLINIICNKNYIDIPLHGYPIMTLKIPKKQAGVGITFPNIIQSNSLLPHRLLPSIHESVEVEADQVEDFCGTKKNK